MLKASPAKVHFEQDSTHWLLYNHMGVHAIAKHNHQRACKHTDRSHAHTTPLQSHARPAADLFTRSHEAGCCRTSTQCLCAHPWVHTGKHAQILHTFMEPIEHTHTHLTHGESATFGNRKGGFLIGWRVRNQL